MGTIGLWKSGMADADINGRAVIELAPEVYPHEWTVQYSSVNASFSDDTEPIPVVTVYQTFENPSSFLEQTMNGRNDTSDSTIKVSYGDKLVYVFSGANHGTHCTVTIRGTIETGRR